MARKAEVGSKVRIKSDALDFLSKKRWSRKVFTVVSVFTPEAADPNDPPEEWVRLSEGHKRLSIWPARMVRVVS